MNSPLEMAAVAFLTDLGADCEILVVAQYPTGEGASLQISRGADFDEQDVALGMDTHCVVVDGATYYGGVVSWRLEGRMLTIELSEAAAVDLGIRCLRIVLPDGGAEIADVALRRLLV